MKVVSTALLIGVLASFLCVLHVHAAIEITKNNDKVASLKEQIKKEALKDPKLASKLIELSLKKVPLPKKPEIIMNKMPVSGALCSSCVDLLDFALADLLAALDSGVVFSCLRLCNSVANLGPYAVELCDVVCTAIGVNAFIDIIKKGDLDPIYACQLGKLCPVHDCTAKTCAAFTATGVIPQVSKLGSTVTAYSRLNVFNESGPGQVTMMLTGPFSIDDMTQRFYQSNGFQPGAYEIKFTISTKDDDAEGLLWFPGQYKVVINACEGECGASRPHTRLLASVGTTFNLTNPIP
ncbi:hypothetical protein FDP41_010042 [Naegleria fowleri]|uniref:Saposin B-type domain-containing protein n=1 Tax=Naegleria fowleri TaxID=5763 RepID=A0A6A5BFH6_NAEFO|nr:uncharacterized protein FDP41_010042 [Naegleria fowleri]KAF0971819.1 hypothetical protein FDP41_010042 [Naegleria fowleri]CAG4707655.1 unnamed protein product [Naegleria fowleri]